MAVNIPSPFYIQNTSERTLVGNILIPFAYDERMCRKVGQGALPFVHIWRHEKALVLGLRDRRLPNVGKAAEWLLRQGYQVAVRNSGGAAVPLDPGVVNVSVVVPNAGGALYDRDDFELMRRLIERTLNKLNVAVEVGEVKGSYCPGDYDLSVAGRKVCGISQRRQTKAAVVQAFVIVEGSGERRAEMIRSFYDLAAEGTAGGYPDVRPEKTASLSELGTGVTVKTFTAALLKTLVESGGVVGRHPDRPSLYELEETAALLKERYALPT